uniref:Acyl-coenzyme A oxidase n=1 Tax=Araucaria cunninghamii TaxID=56994 RepID=A0A0D6R080_ARACU
MAGMDQLAHERERAEFDVSAMKVVWAGSRSTFEVSDRMSKFVASDPVFRKDDRPRLSRQELFKNTLKKTAHAWKLIVDLRLSEEEASKLRFFIDEPAYTDLHWGMFIPAIKGQANDEQQQEWLPLAYKMQIIGCYAQTELGHGSNVQGLETTATFDPKSDEFILNSPTLTSTKWWPGGLGKVSTHAIVYARLITDGRDYGVHGFLVQIRSLEDHRPLPGVTVADIGMKFGNGAYNTMDNGLLQFDHVRIPRKQMFMRFSKVTREGKYLQSDVPRQLVYGAMVYVRQAIVADASNYLSRAVCIAVRYSAVRRQFGSQAGGLETQVIDYKTQQNRLFPLLATAYAFRFVGEWLKWLYMDVTKRLEAKDFSTLAEAHACTAGLKSLTTTVTADGIEDCRKLCGGHGYLCSSGLPELFAVYVPSCTYEGDNTVLLLQVARFLMKTLQQLGSKKPGGTAAYLGKVQYLMENNCNVSQAEDWLKPSVVLEAFEARSARLAVNCAARLREAANPEAGFSELSSDMVEAAVAHCQLIVVSKFIEKLQQDIPGKGVKPQIEILCSVYALSLLHKHQGDFLLVGYLTGVQSALAFDQLRVLYSQVRPNAVALVDAFNYTDHFLGSILGRYDGNVYPHLYEEALKDPLNESVVPQGYEEYIRPVLKQQVIISKL